MQITRVANRPDLAIAEKSGARHWTKNIGEGGRVVVGDAKEILSAPVAGENERGKRLAAFQPIQLCELDQIVMGGDSVAQLVLQGLSRARARPDRHRAALRIGAEQIAHKKIAAL